MPYLPNESSFKRRCRSYLMLKGCINKNTMYVVHLECNLNKDILRTFKGKLWMQ